MTQGASKMKKSDIFAYIRKKSQILSSLLKFSLKEILVIGIIFFLLFLFTIQLPYRIGEHLTIIKTPFEAADVLGFLGDYLSAFGALILGLVAIQQADKANLVSDRVANLEKSRYKEEHDPVVLIEWVKLHSPYYNKDACNIASDGKRYFIDASYESNVNEERQCIEINFTNTGHCGIYNCQLESVSSHPEELKRASVLSGVLDSPFSLKPGKDLKLNLFVYPNVAKRFATKEIQKIKLTFSCVNSFNEKYNLFFEIEGTTHLMGVYQYEEQLVHCQHPVNFNFKAEPAISGK